MENEFKATLQPFGTGIWLDSAPVRIVGTRLTTTMSVVRLADGGLLVCSPIPLTPARKNAVEAIGSVTHLYAPNLFHHLSLGQWSDAFPNARVHAPAGLRKKRPELRIDRAHGTAPEPAFDGLIDEITVSGCRLEESVLFVRGARTLIVADLVHNIGQSDDAWTRLYTRSMGFYDRVALSRILRCSAFSDRATARNSLDALLALPIDRLVVGHGAPLAAGARDALAAAYAWLP